MLGETDEEIQFFCVHDADAAGTKIFETLQEATNARPGRRVKVINLGLEPEEAEDMGLQVETFDSERQRPVADYVEPEWADWLQSHRVELNAMTTPEFIRWLEQKLAVHGVGKVIPSAPVLSDALDESAETVVRQQVMNDILRANGYEARVQSTLDAMRNPLELAKRGIHERVNAELEANPMDRWDVPVKKVALEILGS